MAAVKGLPVPAPDEIPPEGERTASRASYQRPSDANVNSLTVPIEGRSQSYQSDRSGNLSPARPSSSFPTNSSSATNLFRGRAKTLASLGTSKNASSSPAPLEVQLPKDPYVNGQPIEAYLYKDASECPICFLYYPPYLNRTRCCDQPICSECFVQIKRPDPHPPEHHDDPDNPTPAPPPEEEGLLVSEPSACPFCVTPEFGVTYEAPSFRRGLIFSGPASRNPLSSPSSAMASSTSLQTPPTQGRRRATSLAASAPSVITTDRVRPDWAKKLADARAHALRRSAAATALHNAAYMLGGNNPTPESRFILGRRRRNQVSDSASASGSGTPMPENHPLSGLILQTDEQGNERSGRTGSRRDRLQDLDDLMMMEAIRMSLAAEEDRKKKEEKEMKKEQKQKAKEVKKEQKSAKKNGGLYSASNASTSTWNSLGRSTSNLPQSSTSPPPPPSSGKGKAPISANTSSGFNPLSEPTSTLNQLPQSSDNAATFSASQSTSGAPQRHLETQRANLQQPQSQPQLQHQPQPQPQPQQLQQHNTLQPSQQPSQPISLPTDNRTHLRHISNASSAASSIMDFAPSSYHLSPDANQSPNTSGVSLVAGNTDTPPDLQSGTPGNGAGLEPMFNFRSLAAMIGDEEKARRGAQHNEYAEATTPDSQTQRQASVASSSLHADSGRSRGDSGESSNSARSIPPAYVDTDATAGSARDEITSAPHMRSRDIDRKHGDAVISAAHGDQVLQ